MCMWESTRCGRESIFGEHSRKSGNCYRNIDSEKLCEQVEILVIAAVEENKVEANVTAKISSTDNNGVTAEKQEETGENESESVSGIEETKPKEPERFHNRK